MKLLNPKFDLETYLLSLRKASSRILLLDYDGTLAPFRVERNEAFPYEGIPELLNRIMDNGNNRLVIISGRAVSDIVSLLGTRRMPEIWGSHGWEYRATDGSYSVSELPSRAFEGLANARMRAERKGLAGRLELKPASIAVHWRGLPVFDREEIRQQIVAAWKPLSEIRELELHEFDGGLELRVPGKNKGDAVREVLAGSTGDAVAAYFGDDLTDEDAFQALEGRGLRVLVRAEARQSLADIIMDAPDELAEFLAYWIPIPDLDR